MKGKKGGRRKGISQNLLFGFFLCWRVGQSVNFGFDGFQLPEKST